MSGAAALSAAKRRRGGSSATVNDNVGIRQTRETTTSNNVPKRLNALQVIQDHDQRIIKLEENNTKGLSNVEDLAKRFDNFEKKIENVDIEIPKNNTDHLDKIDKLEKEISELKQMVLKIQSFAIETNTAFLKYNINKNMETKETVTKSETPDTTQVETPDTVRVETLDATQVEAPVNMEEKGTGHDV